MRLRQFIELLPEELQPTIEPGNVSYLEGDTYLASWQPVSESYDNVSASWDSLEYIIELTDIEGKTLRQIGTLNMLERKAQKRKENKVEITQ